MSDKEDEIPELAQFREHVANLDKGIDNFSELLDTLDSLDEKKKALWKEVYYNAITDRRAAYVLYNDLLSGVIGQPAQHAIHGPIMSAPAPVAPEAIKPVGLPEVKPAIPTPEAKPAEPTTARNIRTTEKIGRAHV